MPFLKPSPKRDIFDEVELSEPIEAAVAEVVKKVEKDVFDEIDIPRLKEYKDPPKVDLKLSRETRTAIRQEILELLKREIASLVQELKPKPVVETKIVEKIIHTPEKIIERQVLDEARLQENIHSLISNKMTEFERSGRGDRFVPAPIALPTQAGNKGKVLSTDGTNALWVSRSADGAYTTSNVTAARTFDANDTSLDELADLLGTLIADLKTAGIIQ